MFLYHCNLFGSFFASQILQQEMKQEKYCQMPFFRESSTTWQFKRNKFMQEQLSLFGGDPLRIVSWITVLQDCTSSSQAAKEKSLPFFPPISMLTNPGCSIFQASFIWNKLFMYFEKSSPNLQIFRLTPHEDMNANNNWFTIKQAWLKAPFPFHIAALVDYPPNCSAV